MGGVGSFTRQNRTLYVGRLKETRDSEHVLEKHFEEYGEIEKRASLLAPHLDLDDRFVSCSARVAWERRWFRDLHP